MKLKIAVAASICLLTTPKPVFAEMQKTQKVAANGVVLTVHGDDFRGRFEYSSPNVKFKISDSYMESIAFVSKVKEGGVFRDTDIVFLVYYSGDWHRYNSAYFRGGENAEFKQSSRDVVSCRGSRYSGCTYSETFYVKIKPEQLKKYSENGFIPIQIDAESASGTLVSIPVSYIEAIQSVE